MRAMQDDGLSGTTVLDPLERDAPIWQFVVACDQCRPAKTGTG
jgi:hypothetical protein